MIDVERTIVSQYANSATIVQLVQNMNTYLDPRADFDRTIAHEESISSEYGGRSVFD